MSEGVSVRLEEVELPTYVRGPDGPYPRYGWAGWRGTYPYSTQQDLTTEVRPQRHRMVVLENEYLLVAVTPDMVGRVFRLYDKRAGQETFMVPPSIKYQNVSNRGAWIAGGIEFNFGHRGHTCHTVNPVSWAMRTDSDGGASVWVGTTIRPTGSRWALRIRLRPGRAAMDLDVHVMGPPLLPSMMYWWSNAGVEVTRQSRFFYYGLYANALHFQHGWPVCDGLDFSWWRNRLLEADMFLMDAQRDYLGFYDYGRHHGLAQTADVHEAPGQKYFTWGTHEQGQYWDSMFSDTGQTYCEIQRGRLPTQGTTERLPPMACQRWTETWIPLAGTEGFTATESGLVLSVEHEADGAACIRLAAVEARTALTLEAFAGRKRLGRWPVKAVAPDDPFTRRVKLPPDARCDRVRVRDAAGDALLDWTEFHYNSDDWFRDSIGHIELNQGPADEMFAEAERRRFLSWPGGLDECRGHYRQILEQDPGHTGVLVALAEVEFYVGRYERAGEHLRKALQRRPREPECLTLLGWTALKLDRDGEAVRAFADAARCESARRTALVGLAAAHLRAGRHKPALAAVERLLGENPADPWGRWMQVVALRRAGQTAPAREHLRGLLSEQPLWSCLHAEAALLDVPVDLAGGTRTLADDSVTAATPYLDLGLWDDARAVLQRDESDEPFSPAVRLAHLAYACRQLGDASGEAEALQALRRAPAELAHPWTTTSIEVLEALCAAHEGEPMLEYMLGNVLADRYRLDEARARWERAVELGMAHSVCHYNLGRLAAHRQDHETSLMHFRKAWELSGQDVNMFSVLDRALASAGLHQERQAVYEQLDERLRQRSVVAMRRVLQLLDTARYEQALAELGQRTFLRGEFEKTIRYQYLEAIVGRACDHVQAGRWDASEAVLRKGFEYPRNLNIGRHGAMPNEAVLHYWLALAADAQGDEERARASWQAAAEELHMDGHPMQAYEMLAWLALGHRPRALALAHKLEQIARGQADVPWWYKFYYGSAAPQFNHGLAQVAKGHIGAAREIWRKALAENPDGRWLPLHLNLPQAILERMARRRTGPES